MNTYEQLQEILDSKRSVEVIFRHGTIRSCVFGKLESDSEGFYVRHAQEGSASANFDVSDVVKIHHTDGRRHVIIEIGIAVQLTCGDLAAWASRACTHYTRHRGDVRQRLDVDECIKMTAPENTTAEHRDIIRALVHQQLQLVH